MTKEAAIKMETLKINITTYATGQTGGTRSLLNFANEWSKMGHDVSITTLYYIPWFPLMKSVNVITSTRSKFDFFLFYGKSKLFHKLGLSSLNLHVENLKKLYEMIPRCDINVVSFFSLAYVASWKRSESIPLYLIMHMPEYFSEDPLERAFYSDSLFLKVNKIANSSWLAAKIFEATGIDCPVMNMGAADDKIFYPRSKAGSDKPTNTVDIVALGKGGFKNAQLIFEAVQQLRKGSSTRNFRLHFFGQRPPIGVKFDNSSTIFHKKLTDDQLAELYSNSDIQVTFSTAESFPLPPLEAMACGCSVITTPYGTEDYTEDEKNALLVEPNNVKMLVSKLQLLTEDLDLRRKLILNGLKTAKRFRYEEEAKSIEKYMKFLKN